MRDHGEKAAAVLAALVGAVLASGCATIATTSELERTLVEQRALPTLRVDATRLHSCAVDGVNIRCQLDVVTTCTPRHEKTLRLRETLRHDLSGYDLWLLPGEPVQGQLNAILLDVAFGAAALGATGLGTALLFVRGGTCFGEEPDPLCVPYPVYGGLLILGGLGLVVPPVLDYLHSRDEVRDRPDVVERFEEPPRVCDTRPAPERELVAVTWDGQGYDLRSQARGVLRFTPTEPPPPVEGPPTPWLRLYLDGDDPPVMVLVSDEEIAGWRAAWDALQAFKAQARLALDSARVDARDGQYDLAVGQLASLPLPRSTDAEADALIAELQATRSGWEVTRWLQLIPGQLDLVEQALAQRALTLATVRLKLARPAPMADARTAELDARRRALEARLVAALVDEVSATAPGEQLEALVQVLELLRDVIAASPEAEAHAADWQRAAAAASALALPLALGADPARARLGLAGVADLLDTAEQLARAAGDSAALAQLQARRSALGLAVEDAAVDALPPAPSSAPASAPASLPAPP